MPPHYTVLYVDDEPGLLEIAKVFLEQSEEFRVDTFTSAQEALKSGKIPSYDAIIADYQMPLMDGITFLKEIRERFGDIPFILFTGRGREEVVIEAINNGADFYLQKGGHPQAQFAELAHKIRRAIHRKRAELSIIESEKRLADIINFLPDATFAIDRTGHVIAWNRAIEEMTGIPAAGMLGKGDNEYAIPFYGSRRKILIDLIFEPDDIIARNYAHIIHDKDILIADTSFPRPRGRTVTLMGKASPLYNREGEIVGAIESIRDITALKEAETSLLHAKKDWETIFRAIGHPAMVLDPENRILDANDATVQATGLSVAELKGRNCYEIFHPAGTTAPPVSCPCAKLKKSGQAEMEETEIEGLNGYYSVTCTPVFDENGRLEKVIHIAMDITRRRKTEDELRAAYTKITASEEELRDQYEALAAGGQRIRESESRFRELAELLPQLVFEMDRDLRITFANRHALVLTGLSPEDLARGVNALSFIDAGEHGRARAALERLARGEPDEDHEFTAIRADGSRFPALIYVAPILRGGKTAGFRGVLVDISAHRKAEEALRQANIVVENSPVVVFRWKAEEGWPVVYVSQNVALFGYSAEELLSGAVPYSSLVHPEDLERVVNEVRDFSGRRIDRFMQEYRIVTKDGRTRWIDDRTIIERDPAGTITHYQGIIIDITDRRLAEQRIRESEEKYRTVVETAEEGIWIIDKDYRTVFTNRKMEEILGYSQEEMLGRPVWDFILPEEAGPMRSMLLERTAGRTGRYEHQWVKKDGTVIWCLTSGTPLILSDGSFAGSFGMFTDITRRKEMEEALRESEENYRSIIENIQDVVYRTDRAGNLTMLSPSFVTRLGYDSADECLGKNIADQFWMYPERRQEFLRELEKNGSISGYEVTIRKKDGTPIIVSASSHFYYARDGTIAGVEGVFHDITEIKQAQQEVRLLAGLNDISPASVTVHTPDGEFLYANQRTYDMHGWTRDEFMKLNLHQLDVPDSEELIRERIEKLKRTGEAAFDVRHYRKDGSTIPLHVIAKITRWNGRDVIMSVATGIPDRKRAKSTAGKRGHTPDRE
ncbi:MAG: sensory histidine kinase AtoS [Methanoregula sp. PtaU1.Bin006]|uniref:PAS domain S-box protein n=1 Tax=Methanoregula sp. PtaU1.Bin006 TaxID=1811681 RepID=UPI0009D16DB0|nr:PAS domain S-box protein [Methanoregula sp. PtaU1.Bin006]OPY32807.1 MAG: sensory histidine kinase AtoS [Methanoregula sp. PtaU1.Bin006]